MITLTWKDAMRRVQILSPNEFNHRSEEDQMKYIMLLSDHILDDQPVSDEEEKGEASFDVDVVASDNEELESFERNNVGDEVHSHDFDPDYDPEYLDCTEEEYDDDVVEVTANSAENSDVYVAQNGKEWQKEPLHAHQAKAHNIFRARSGPVPTTKKKTEVETFKCFIDPSMVDIILRSTNRKAHETYAAYNAKFPNNKQLIWTDATLEEMYAFIGVLIMIGANHATDDSIRDLWHITSFPLCRATMSFNRFWSLLRFLRFDNVKTRRARMALDNAAPIRDIWTLLNHNLASNYKPSAELIIDEQLVQYRGKTKFKQYIPSIRGKYGIKVWWICDAKNSYPLHGELYTAKLAESHGTNQDEIIVKELSAPYMNAYRNITINNSFTSLPTAEFLLKHKTTVVGTLQKNKPYIPKSMKPNKTREVGTTIFGFSGDVTICSYVPRKQQCQILLSTKHSDASINDNGKPEMLNYFNKTKGGVNVMEQMLGEYTTQRQCNRWPLSLFYNVIDIAAFAAYIIYNENNKTIRQKLNQRQLFLRRLAGKLCMPLIEKRSINEHINCNFSSKTAIEAYIGKSMERVHIQRQLPLPCVNASIGKKRPKEVVGCCYLCLSQEHKRRRKTRKACIACVKAVCDPHSINYAKCIICAQQQPL